MPVRVTGPDPAILRRTILRMAEQAVQDIRKRAFPTNARAGRNVEGGSFKRLTPAYQKRKAEAGHHPVPDQRFTSGTANALGVTNQTRGSSVSIGFRDRREIADGLERRNRFWGLTERERARVDRVAQQAGADVAKAITVTGTVISGR